MILTEKYVNSLSVCVKTEVLSEKYTIDTFPASPQCFIGGNTASNQTVHPGKVTISIDASPLLTYDASPCPL